MTTFNREDSVVATDMDQCIGFFNFASAIHGLFTTYIPKTTGISLNKCVNIFKDIMVKYYLPNGGARPGTKEILQMMNFYKNSGYIRSVVMFTSSTNNNNWVFCLKDCLEEFANVKGLYDLVLHRDNTEAKVSVDGATIKCLNMLREKLGVGLDVKVVIIDDKPHNIKGDGEIIPVTPYSHIVSRTVLSAMLDDAFDKLDNAYKPKIGTYPPISLKKMVKNTCLDGPTGINTEIKNNFRLGYPIDQLDDTDLIEKSLIIFMDHIKIKPLIRSTSEARETLCAPSNLQRNSSLPLNVK